MSHTPGPWIARNQKSRDGEDLGWIIEVDGGRGGRIGWSSRAFADTNKEEDCGGPEAKANAHLMAAAPEMLEALNHITDEMELADFDPNDTDTWYGRALAIIAKATGGAQ